jgi:hypothetical protein
MLTYFVVYFYSYFLSSIIFIIQFFLCVSLFVIYCFTIPFFLFICSYVHTFLGPFLPPSSISSLFPLFYHSWGWHNTILWFTCNSCPYLFTKISPRNKSLIFFLFLPSFSIVDMHFNPTKLFYCCFDAAKINMTHIYHSHPWYYFPYENFH